MNDLQDIRVNIIGDKVRIGIKEESIFLNQEQLKKLISLILMAREVISNKVCKGYD